MTPAVEHFSEIERLETVKQLRILDTPSEELFDACAHKAALNCATPSSIISIVDYERVWFKSRIGWDLAETARDHSPCDRALRERAFVVEDAAADERVCRSPIVAGRPAVRFYAGLALSVASVPVGVLAVVDYAPRQLNPLQMESLRATQEMLNDLLEARRTRMELEGARAMVTVCAWCRQVKNEQGEWVPMHHHLSEHTPITHGICPSCATKMVANHRQKRRKMA